MTRDTDATTSLHRYGLASERAAEQIIRAYSTSFGAATRLLGERHRTHVRNVSALVRVADELVDGVTAEAGLSPEQQMKSLDALETETETAMQCGFSSNPVLHAFARSARLAGIDRSLTLPFFASMRMDLRPGTSAEGASAASRAMISFGERAHADYVYGSAEVVGLMCLRIFVRDEMRSPEELQVLENGARNLGAAFQNVNFLRDLADDTDRLARNYLSGGEPITEHLKSQWIGTIREQLEVAEAAVPLLPLDARVGVDCARRLFSRLNERLAQTPVEELFIRRIRVSNPRKALLVAQSLAGARRNEPR